MDASILRRLLNCNLTEEESLPIQLEEYELTDGIIECEASIYVKIHSLKENFVSLQGFTLAMSKALNCRDVRVSRMMGSVFHVFFPSLGEKKRIYEIGPWCFDNQLLVIKKWRRGEDPLKIDFDSYFFWTQVRGLKGESFTKDVAHKIIKSFNGCEAVE
ncbi:hypothetical protein LIER_14348 [Lithospermum erythrorhizon]|uniref:DUF4283 domain-containing protein n=1 Tax=Lithospermum erythrorhizon TaxID=34254 RepID=A0AAV3Q136_LITER